MTADNGQNPKDSVKEPAAAPDQDFDIEADLRRLKRSSYVLASLLIALVIAFLAVVSLNLLSYLRIQQATDVPPVYAALYAAQDGVPIFSESNPLSPQVGTMRAKDRVFELQRTPGLARVQKDTLIGWVPTDKTKSKLEILTSTESPKMGIQLNLAFELSWDKSNLRVAGRLTNKAETPIKNVRVVVYFLGPNTKIISQDTVTVSPKEDISKGQTAAFSIIGTGLMGRVAALSYDIENFEAVLPPAPEPTAAEDDSAADAASVPGPSPSPSPSPTK